MENNDQPKSRIVQGTIEPIRADKLFKAKEEIRFSHRPLDPNVHHPKIVNHSPFVVAPETLEFAKQVAERILSDEVLKTLPENQAASEMISLALAVKHFTKET